MNYSGSNWIKTSLKMELSDFGSRVADLLGVLEAGIYHIETRWLTKVNWMDDHFIEITIRDGGRFSTYDSCKLTDLVILCHDLCIRCELNAATHGYITLRFHPRHREGGISESHSTIEQAIERLRRRAEMEAAA